MIFGIRVIDRESGKRIMLYYEHTAYASEALTALRSIPSTPKG